jgi:hypothetical protein
MDWCSVYLTPRALPKYIYLSRPLIFPTTSTELGHKTARCESLRTLLHYVEWDRIVTLTEAQADWRLRYRIYFSRTLPSTQFKPGLLADKLSEVQMSYFYLCLCVCQYLWIIKFLGWAYRKKGGYEWVWARNPELETPNSLIKKKCNFYFPKSEWGIPG